MNILVFGDSIAYGIQDKEKGGWVNRLHLALDSERDQVFNLSIGGQTTVEIKARFEYECNYRRSSFEDTLVVFAIGINDSPLLQGNERRSIEDFGNNMNALISCAKKYAAHILAVGLTKADEARTVPIPWNKDICYLNERILAFDQRLKDLCGGQAIDYIQLYSLLEIDDLADGLHPNEIGHQKISEAILTYIIKTYLSSCA